MFIFQVRKCFPEIVTELRHGLVSDQARVREASCRAVRTLLKHEAADPLILAELGELVRCLVRVMDDTRMEIKDAAIETAKSVEKVDNEPTLQCSLSRSSSALSFWTTLLVANPWNPFFRVSFRCSSTKDFPAACNKCTNLP